MVWSNTCTFFAPVIDLINAFDNNLFDQKVTNAEDHLWGKKVINSGFQLAYCADAKVFHHHGLHQNNISNNISNLKRNGFKKFALVSELMNSEDPKEDAMMILKKLSHEN